MCLIKTKDKELTQYTSSVNTSFVFIAVSQKSGTPLAENSSTTCQNGNYYHRETWTTQVLVFSLYHLNLHPQQHFCW
jgi:hypothetical protein